ncbi:MAG: acyltransferase [Xanthobacteraceae bacterium]|nr:acyltransferase [Xanthobacteraceae bacterium]
MKIAYRPEIDGLRTIAVLGVVLFHLGVTGFGGGFTGVDVFFVISGYLITRNILGDIERGSFSFADFYARRFRRILPALIFTVALTFIAGLLWLGPLAMRQLAKESTHALLSIANIQYWREFKQYFSPNADDLALLHTWSLSAEEQFYLIWPLFLVLAARSGKIFAAIVTVGLISFAAAFYWSKIDNSATFFLMPFRIFEFAIGAAVISVERKIRDNAFAHEGLTLFGLVAIVGSMLFLDSTSPFFTVTLLPCLGAAAIIAAGSQSGRSRLLTSSPMLAIGRASYSLYLCHWPMIVFARIVFGNVADTALGIALNFTLMIAVALLMQRYVEQPFRQAGLRTAPKITLYRFTALICALGVVTYGTFRAGGLEWRLTEEARAQTLLLSPGASVCPLSLLNGLCDFGQLDAPLTLELIGDSYAIQYLAGLDPLLKELHMRGEGSKTEGCPVLAGMPVPPKSWNPARCKEHSEIELARLGASATHVIISHNWLTYQNSRFAGDPAFSIPSQKEPYSFVQKHLEQTIQTLQKPGRKFLIVGAQITADQCRFNMARVLPGPLPRAPASECPPKPREKAVVEGAGINAMLREVQRKFPDQVQLWIPVETFCDAMCPTTRDGTLLYFDSGHYNVAGSKYAVERARDLLIAFLKS